VDLVPLKGTSGIQDCTVPASADAMTLHMVVLRDTGMGHAIAAAPLGSASGALAPRPVQPMARIRLFLAAWVTSARPSASRSGGR
jgi:hypothetical protein